MRKSMKNYLSSNICNMRINLVSCDCEVNENQSIYKRLNTKYKRNVRTRGEPPY